MVDTPFVDPADLNSSQLVFATLVYAVVLYQASNLISGGSELLMLVPAVAGIVGSIVLPILGAVPDGMMVLFSGVGPDAQETVSVGVGALAGSTVMLLTFPWFVCVMFGRAPIKGGKADYSDKQTPITSGNSGITFSDSIAKNSMIMLATTLLYGVIQFPAMHEELKGSGLKAQAAAESMPALVGLVLSIAAFFGYLVYCFLDANEDKQLSAIVEGIEKKEITLGTALQFIKGTEGSASQRELLDKGPTERLRKICKPFFRRYDLDHSGSLSKDELGQLVHDLGLSPSAWNSAINDAGAAGTMAAGLMPQMDEDKSGEVDLDEFVKYLYVFLQDESRMQRAPHSPTAALPQKPADEDDEEEEMPEDLASLSPAEQMRRVITRSCWMMGVGTLLVLAFSDPMVDCLNEWGKRLGISAFYISFVLAPFASNASELLSAYTYAVKKTEKSMTTSLSTLIGAACMNNTFVFGIFLALVYSKGLAWQFSAETFAMVVVQWVVGIIAIASRTQTTPMGFFILGMYPGCLAIVWACENILGWD